MPEFPYIAGTQRATYGDFESKPRAHHASTIHLLTDVDILVSRKIRQDVAGDNLDAHVLTPL